MVHREFKKIPITIEKDIDYRGFHQSIKLRSIFQSILTIFHLAIPIATITEFKKDCSG